MIEQPFVRWSNRFFRVQVPKRWSYATGDLYTSRPIRGRAAAEAFGGQPTTSFVNESVGTLLFDPFDPTAQCAFNGIRDAGYLGHAYVSVRKREQVRPLSHVTSFVTALDLDLPDFFLRRGTSECQSTLHHPAMKWASSRDHTPST